MAIAFETIGENDVRVFSLDPATRARRLARKAGLDPDARPEQGGARVLADLGFAWDPAWLRQVASRPGSVVTLAGRPVLAHVEDGDAPVIAAMRQAAGYDGPGTIPAEGGTDFHDAALRKRETPFLMPLRADTARTIERAAYDGAYKGVTDLLTLYLWRRLAFYLTRWAAAAGISPNAVTTVGALFCVAAFFFFWHGQYWAGIATGFTFMVLDTVDGKLARCTGTSSRWGHIFDHGVDLIHPPFWWAAWGVGLDDYGRPLSPDMLAILLGVILGGYIVQRGIEGVFMRRFDGIHIHVWRPIDSQFRLITARRNPNMLLLVGALAFRRPDIGLILVAGWTALSLVFHAVRLVQALIDQARRPARGVVAGVSGRWSAILLAGQRPGEDQFAASFGVALKPLIPVVGQTMVGRVAAVLGDCPEIGRVLVLTQSPEAIAAALPPTPAITVRASGDGISRSVAAAAGGPEAPWPVLVTTADHVLLTPAVIADFLAQAGGCDVAFAMVERRTVLARFPATRRTWLRFAGGAYTGANLFALNGPAGAAALALWSEVEADRKKGWRLIFRLGPTLLLRALTRTISLHDAVARAGASLGIAVKPVVLGDARAAVDVDKPADHALATAVLEGRA